MKKRMSAIGGSAYGRNKKNICLIVLILAMIFGLGISHYSQAQVSGKASGGVDASPMSIGNKNGGTTGTPASSASGSASTTYKPMENIPGSEGVTDFVPYIKGIYKFGIWTIGIAALMMIMIGGFMYISSAGNNATMGKAKGYIYDAIIGLIMAMTAWILLNEINPKLVSIDIKFPSGTSGGAGGAQTAAQSAAQQQKNQQECNDYCNGKPDGENTDIAACNSKCMAAKQAQQQQAANKVSTNASCNNLGNSDYNSEVQNAANAYGVPPALLNAFVQRECPTAMANSSGGCVTSNNSINGKNGGAMQFDDATWSTYKCTGSKFNRQDALNCGAKKIAKDSGGDYSDTGITKAAKAYCGACNASACGGSYCDGILANYNVYKNC